MLFLLPIAAPIVTLAAITKYFSGENLSKYDEGLPVTFECDPNSKGVQILNEYLEENFAKPAKGHKGGEPIATKRERFDDGGRTRKFPKVKFTPLTIPTNYGDMSGEWITAKNNDPDKRILYIHGGAFTVGSAMSHRAITAKLAELTGASVCAINYRLMPENPRKASVEDSRYAYKWVLENGPDGPFSVKKLCVSGDSAGGNLALSLLQWARGEGLRPADAAVPLSPLIDSTFSGPSIHTNLASDHMLRPMVGALTKVPRPLLLWGSWKNLGYSPSSPIISPIFGDLTNLPPTLIQVSSTEILYDDARRYTTKAKRAGSEVKLQSWSNMCHVWQIFDEMLPEANDATKEIAKFLKGHGF